MLCTFVGSVNWGSIGYKRRDRGVRILQWLKTLWTTAFDPRGRAAV